jgi:transcriptional regulator with PAS, ATPase and Fis domain
VDEGRFREDLYFRLDVVRIHLPPLRERGREDLEALSAYLLERVRERLGRGPRSLDAAARARLAAHSWPGNVRELENALERAVIVSGDAEVIEAGALALRPGACRALGPRVSLPDDGIDLRAVLDAVEERLIRQALERTAGNRQQAAGLLGLQRTTLVQKLRRRGIEAQGLGGDLGASD